MEIKVGHIRVFDSSPGIMALWVAVSHSMMTFDIQLPSLFAKLYFGGGCCSGISPEIEIKYF
jgi:hypothetical protein